MHKRTYAKIAAKLDEAKWERQRAVQIISESTGHTGRDSYLIMMRIERLGWELRPYIDPDDNDHGDDGINLDELSQSSKPEIATL